MIKSFQHHSNLTGPLLQLLTELSPIWKMTVLTGIGVGQNLDESLGAGTHLDGCVVGPWEGKAAARERVEA